MDKEKALFERYENFIEHLFEEHRWYRELVYLSKITKMFAYLLLGMSIIIVVINGGNLFTLENLIVWMSKTSLGV